MLKTSIKDIAAALKDMLLGEDILDKDIDKVVDNLKNSFEPVEDDYQGMMELIDITDIDFDIDPNERIYARKSGHPADENMY